MVSEAKWGCLCEWAHLNDLDPGSNLSHAVVVKQIVLEGLKLELKHAGDNIWSIAGLLTIEQGLVYFRPVCVGGAGVEDAEVNMISCLKKGRMGCQRKQ